MQIIRGIHNLRPKHQCCVATIGNFDGMHLGHQAVLQNLIYQSKLLNLPSTVIIFEPQPQEYFAKHPIPARLTRLREKLIAINAAGIDRVLLLNFNASLVTTPAEQFIEHVLVQALQVKFLFVGDDFRFGKQRQGDFALLKQSGIKHSFQVKNMSTIRLTEKRVSSTRIRNALGCGDLNTATYLLGHPYSLCGRVSHGAKRGRTIGFPTANINLRRRTSPVRGVYGVRVLGNNGLSWPGVANIGQRPTVTGDPHVWLEVHLFGFNGNLYRHYLTIELLHRLRDEQRFKSIEELRQQIALDVKQAKSLLLSPTE